MERSWQVFLKLETFQDGMGGWRILDVTGKSIMDHADWLVDDLITWRNLARRVDRQNRARNKEN